MAQFDLLVRVAERRRDPRRAPRSRMSPIRPLLGRSPRGSPNGRAAHRPPSDPDGADDAAPARRDGDAEPVAAVEAVEPPETTEAVAAGDAVAITEVGAAEPAPQRRALSPLNPPIVALATTVLFLLGLLAYVVLNSDSSAPAADDRPALTEVAPIVLNGD
jgi:hypothetical protein